jgi:Icc-related predicted phosphoesterase
MTLAPAHRTSLRIAAVGDLHCTGASHGTLGPWLGSLHEHADVLLLCGDLTDGGRASEAHCLAHELSAVRVPMLGVLGNHDYGAGDAARVSAVLRDAGVRMLGDETAEVQGVGFVGVKGFAGGFGDYALHYFGERSIKQVLQETVDDARRLDAALSHLAMAQRVVLLHYSPVRATIAAEPRETHAFFGSSRLEEPLLRHSVTAVFHGHAHRGPLEGATARGTPVYNVAAPLLRRCFPRQPPYRVVTLPAPD